MSSNPARKHLLLVGAGRTHLQVLKGLARQMSSDMAVTFVTPSSHHTEAALLPSHLGGQHELDTLRVPLDALLAAGSVQPVLAQVQALDPVNRQVQLSNGQLLTYDVLSVDTEPTQDREAIEARMPGARAHALFLRPLDAFVQLWPQLLALARQRPLHLAVLADDLFGLELALAIGHALGSPHTSRVTLVNTRPGLFEGLPPGLQRRLPDHFQRLGLTVLQDSCVGIDEQTVHLASGARLQCDAPLLACAAALPRWLADSGLDCDTRGQPQLNTRLQSDSHRQVFVVPSHVPPEAGPALEANLRTALGGGSFRQVPRQRPRLQVFDCGQGQAIATWGPLSLAGREVWHWNDRRERRQLAELLAL